MKRNKTLLIMLAVLAVLCAASFGISRFELKKEQIRKTDSVILSIDPSDVISLSWSYGSTELSFHREESWIYDGDESFPVDTAKLEDTLAVFAGLGADFIIEDPDDVDLYGLSSPGCTIRLETADAAYKILLGMTSKMDAERYVSIGDGRVYLVNEDPMPYFEKTLSSFIRNDEIPSFYTITDITFTGSENYTIISSEDETLSICADDRYYTERDGVLQPLDSANLTSWSNALQNLTLTSYISYNALDSELAAWGLDEPELTAEVAYETVNGDIGSFTISIGSNREELQQSQEDDTVSVTRYIRVGQSRIIYTLTTAQYKNLTKVSYDDLRHAELLTAEFDNVTAIDITLEGNLYQITTEKEGDEARKFFYEGTELEELQLSGLRTASRSMRASSYTDESAEGRLEIRVVYHLASESFPQMEIELYRYDGAYCLAVINGVSSCLLTRSSAIELIEAVNAIVLG